MIAVNAFMFLFATWRLTELLMEDGLAAPVRKFILKFGWGQRLMACSRCVSFWAACVALASFIWFPYFNWPLAGSMLFIYLTPVLGKAQRRGVLLQPTPDGRNIYVDFDGMEPAQAIAMMKRLVEQHEHREQTKLKAVAREAAIK